MKRIAATVITLFALFQGLAAQHAIAIVDSASVNVNFTDFGFFDSAGVRRDDEILVVTGANFEAVSDIELGNATAATDGDADIAWHCGADGAGGGKANGDCCARLDLSRGDGVDGDIVTEGDL